MTTGILTDGGRATGVKFEQNGKTRTVTAAKVWCCALCRQSPQILELSGIGNPNILRQYGIEVVHSLPGVGENYQDHYMVRQTWEIKKKITLNEQTRGYP